MEDRVYATHILTPTWELGDMRLLEPVLSLNSQQKLSLHFDDFHPDLPSYAYRVILCKKNWEKEDRMQDFEYMNAFGSTDLWDYSFSSGTFESYAHYQIDLPNDEVEFLESGNYIIQVFMQDEPDSVILQKRFYVLEDKTSISGVYRPSRISQYSFSHQELVFDVTLDEGVNVIDPYRDVSISAMQNGQWSTSMHDIRPNFVMNRQLKFEDNRTLLFPGGKEFREFDISTLQFPTNRVHSIETRNSINRAYLQPDEIDAYKSYVSKKDINGGYLPLLKDRTEQHTESDYAWVYFSLKSPNPYPDDIYLFGQLTGWETQPRYKLEYDLEYGTYTVEAFVKQGFYNYRYVNVPVGDSLATTSLIEGNSEETENRYAVFVYYHPPGARSDKLIGYSILDRY